MGKTYVSEYRGLDISWERDTESWDGKKYSRLRVTADIHKNLEASLKTEQISREIVEFIKDNKLMNDVGMHCGTSMNFGRYAIGDPAVLNYIRIDDYSENYAVYDFAIGKVNELFELDLK